MKRLDLTRRQTIHATAVLALPGTAAGQGALPPPPIQAPADLWYAEPAREWVQALPVGNGRLGGMVFGGVSTERIQLNEDTFFAGGPYDPVNPRALEALTEVRRRVFAEDFVEATRLADEALMGNPLRQMAYQPLGDLILLFPGLDNSRDYVRELDLDEAVARTRFRLGGTTHVREVFVSPVDQVMVVRLSASRPGAITVDLSLSTPQSADLDSDGPDTIVCRGVGPAQGDIDGKLRFETRIKVMHSGGTLALREGGAFVRGADEVVLLLAAATSYRRFDDVSGDPEALTRAVVEPASKKPYATLVADHRTEHQRLFNRLSIDLGTSEAAGLPTDERIRRSGELLDPELAALYVRYGRYLLMSSSRPGTQPANLQGIWNDKTNPSWQSKWTLNINAQMNYWPAEPANLPECVEPLIAMVRDLAETGARTARTMYGAKGWVVHNNTDIWRATAPVDGAIWSLWPTGGAWLCQHLWERYEYGGDPAYLAEVYPLMKGAAEFFLDTLVEDPGSGHLVTCPSMSPENRHLENVSICAGPAMDSQILRDLFGNCITAAGILGINRQFSAACAQARARLPADRIGAQGQLQEWLEDWDARAPDQKHRHVSHLYALHPSSQINLRDTPALAAAARRSLEMRGDDATGWGIGWRINLWARLGDGDRAHDVLKLLLQPSRSYPNLFDAHPPFQIDGNFGGAAGILEMLMQSWGGTVHLLPALPSAWPTGAVAGLRAKGGFTIDLNWRNGALETATVTSDRRGPCSLTYQGATLALALSAGEVARIMTRDNALVRMTA